ncbi:Os08g0217800, partial [Oryza sativa Japonica Group]
MATAGTRQHEATACGGRQRRSRGGRIRGRRPRSRGSNVVRQRRRRGLGGASGRRAADGDERIRRATCDGDGGNSAARGDDVWRRAFFDVVNLDFAVYFDSDIRQKRSDSFRPNPISDGYHRYCIRIRI